MSISDYDVIVLGGGATREHAAAEIAERGLRVAVVERELVGGECSSMVWVHPVARPGPTSNRRWC